MVQQKTEIHDEFSDDVILEQESLGFPDELRDWQL